MTKKHECGCKKKSLDASLTGELEKHEDVRLYTITLHQVARYVSMPYGKGVDNEEIYNMDTKLARARDRKDLGGVM